MPNLFDHVRAFGDLTLEQRPFDELDSLALTQIVYMPFEGLLDAGGSVTLAQAWDFLRETYPDSFTDPFQHKRYDFTALCAANQRYRDWVLHDYINDIDNERVTQFCACTFEPPGSGLSYIALRGTDLTLVGWREDLNMSYMTIPAQTETVEYLERIAARTGDALMLGGHSKGGNLALYAAAHAHSDTQARIRRAYSFDGPGVSDDTLKSLGYELVRERVESYIPQSSFVGMLLSYHPVYTVVKSDAWGLLQHDALTWQVSDGAFETQPDLAPSGKFADETLRGWIDTLSPDDRRMLTDTVFRVAGAANTDDVGVLLSTLPARMPSMMAAIRALEPDTRMSARRILHGLFTSGAAEIARMLLPRTLRTLGGLSASDRLKQLEEKARLLRPSEKEPSP